MPFGAFCFVKNGLDAFETEKNTSSLHLIKLRSKQINYDLYLNFKQAAVQDLIQRNPG